MALGLRLFQRKIRPRNTSLRSRRRKRNPIISAAILRPCPILFGLDRNAALYKLNFYNRNVGATTPEYDGTLQLEGSLEKGISRFYFKTNTAYTNNYQTATQPIPSFSRATSLLNPRRPLSPNSARKRSTGAKAMPGTRRPFWTGRRTPMIPNWPGKGILWPPLIIPGAGKDRP